MELSQMQKSKFFVGDDVSKNYFLNRPNYPATVLDTILSYLTSGDAENKSGNQQFNTAVDIACGSGQATVPLAKHFKSVIGCDVSETQIKEAQHRNKCNNIEFHVSAAEDMAFIPTGSVDLVTCAAAFRYLDQEKVCWEVDRVLRNNGVFAMYAYGRPILPNAEAQQAFNEYYRAFPITTTQLATSMIGYMDITLPMDDIKRRQDLTLEWEVPLSRFIAFLQTGYRYRSWMKEHQDSDILQTLRDRLLSTLDSEEVDPPLHLTFPISILMGRKIRKP